MKLVLALSLLFSFASQAMTLEQYDASNSYLVAWPQVVMSNLSVPVKNICSEGELLKTISPVTYCSQPAVVEVCTRQAHAAEECRPVRQGEKPVQAPGTRWVWGCAGYKSAYLATSKYYMAQVCTRWEEVQNGHNNKSYTCVEFGQEARTYPTDYMVSVDQATVHNGGWVEVAALPFSIPACK